jgi:hypothetical protein
MTGDAEFVLRSFCRCFTVKSTLSIRFCSTSLKFLGAGLPLKFADVETIGLRKRFINSLQNSSLHILIAIEPSSLQTPGARFFPLG